MTTAPEIYLDVTRADWAQALAHCHAHDVEKGGCFDARMVAINLWSHPWSTSPESRKSSRLLATFYPAYIAERGLEGSDYPAAWTLGADTIKHRHTGRGSRFRADGVIGELFKTFGADPDTIRRA